MSAGQSLSRLFHAPPLTIDADSDLAEALRLMSEQRISCLLVRRPAAGGGDGEICGIVTEKDLVRSYSGMARHAGRHVADIMTAGLQTVPASMGHLEAYRLMMERKIRHLPVTDDRGRIIGIVTESDYVRHLGSDYYVRLKDVASVMAPVSRLEGTACLCQALELLARSDVTCVVSGTADGRLGILTERDVVRLLRDGADAETTVLAAVMTSPVVTVPCDATLLDASTLLAEHGIRRVVVVDAAGGPVGVLGQHEIVKGLENEYIGHLEGVILEKNRALAELDEAHQTLERQSTLLRRMLDELSAAHAGLREFTKIAAHDLQEPLRLAVTYGQMLERHSQGRLDEQGQGLLQTMLGQSERARRLVQGLVGYSASMASLERLEAISSAEAVTGALALLQSQISQSGAVVEVAADLPPVHASRAVLVEIFTSLIGNAVKFRHPDRPPHVEISAVRETGSWHFIVADNGIGIEKAYLERIFGLFTRLHPAGAYAGSGVGLAVCRRLAALAGGKVWAESDPGRGSRFHLTLGDDANTGE
ncbi:phytochrome-like protein cph1 [mine drainage metagenome]|uniref:histidine kinase n=1 Tax=mine drainage metagenome TaxID=410659 RepID=A0A1J5R447_9ZZZZ